MSKVIPASEVITPLKNWNLIKVLQDQGEGKESIAIGRWKGKVVMAIRTNGDTSDPTGFPQVRGLPTWYIVKSRTLTTSVVYSLESKEQELAKLLLEE